MKDALKKLGFAGCEETAVGAHVVTLEYARILEEGIMDNMITTCCPSTVFLVQKYFPNLTKQLAPVLSPMETHGQMIFKEWGEDVSVVFFGPCISKIEEARISLPHYIDHVVTFKQLAAWLQVDKRLMWLNRLCAILLVVIAIALLVEVVWQLR